MTYSIQLANDLDSSIRDLKKGFKPKEWEWPAIAKSYLRGRELKQFVKENPELRSAEISKLIEEFRAAALKHQGIRALKEVHRQCKKNHLDPTYQLPTWVQTLIPKNKPELSEPPSKKQKIPEHVVWDSKMPDILRKMEALSPFLDLGCVEGSQYRSLFFTSRSARYVGACFLSDSPSLMDPKELLKKGLQPQLLSSKSPLWKPLHELLGLKGSRLQENMLAFDYFYDTLQSCKDNSYLPLDFFKVLHQKIEQDFQFGGLPNEKRNKLLIELKYCLSGIKCQQDRGNPPVIFPNVGSLVGVRQNLFGWVFGEVIGTANESCLVKIGITAKTGEFAAENNTIEVKNLNDLIVFNKIPTERQFELTDNLYELSLYGMACKKSPTRLDPSTLKTNPLVAYAKDENSYTLAICTGINDEDQTAELIIDDYSKAMVTLPLDKLYGYVPTSIIETNEIDNGQFARFKTLIGLCCEFDGAVNLDPKPGHIVGFPTTKGPNCFGLILSIDRETGTSLIGFNRTTAVIPVDKLQRYSDHELEQCLPQTDDELINDIQDQLANPPPVYNKIIKEIKHLVHHAKSNIIFVASQDLTQHAKPRFGRDIHFYVESNNDQNSLQVLCKVKNIAMQSVTKTTLEMLSAILQGTIHK